MTQASASGRITCIVWDYDGTLVDTRAKNLSVTKGIIAEVLDERPEAFPVFASPEIYDACARRYPNWREFYADQFNMDQTQIDRAGLMWTESQAKDQTPVVLVRGIAEVVEKLADYPQGIVSQNATDEIRGVLARDRLDIFFNAIVGYRDVPIDRQKPEPDGLLMCIQLLTDNAPGRVVYIGDHDTDTRCAQRANAVFRDRNLDIQVTTIGVQFGRKLSADTWRVKPDRRAAAPQTVLDLIAEIGS